MANRAPIIVANRAPITVANRAPIILVNLGALTAADPTAKSRGRPPHRLRTRISSRRKRRSPSRTSHHAAHPRPRPPSSENPAHPNPHARDKPRAARDHRAFHCAVPSAPPLQHIPQLAPRSPSPPRHLQVPKIPPLPSRNAAICIETHAGSVHSTAALRGSRAMQPPDGGRRRRYHRDFTEVTHTSGPTSRWIVRG